MGLPLSQESDPVIKIRPFTLDFLTAGIQHPKDCCCLKVTPFNPAEKIHCSRQWNTVVGVCLRIDHKQTKRNNKS